MPGGDGPVRIAFYDAYALSAGAGLALRDIIARIDRDRFEPVALLPREGALAELLREIDCPVEILAPPPPLSTYGGGLTGAGPVMKVRGALALARYGWTVARWLRRSHIELLHCNQTRAAVQAGPGGRLAGIPVIWNVRIRERLPRILVRLADLCSDRIIPLTPNDFAGRADEDRLLRKSTIIPNAVDIEAFRGDSDRKAARNRLDIAPGRAVILSVGILVHRKGFDTLIRALATVVESQPDVLLLIAGEAPEGVDGGRGELEDLVDSLGLHENVQLLGWREDVADLLTACDLFALASRREGDPAAVLEAMASARPVVVTPPAASAVEDGVTGLVVHGDGDAFAAAMAQILGSPRRARQMGRTGRGVVEERHEIGAMVRSYGAVWEDVVFDGDLP